MKTINCNKCGKELTQNDNIFSFQHRIGYGSKYDGDLIDLEFCTECFDSQITSLIKNCKFNPLIKS